ncbi:hypothetical protein ACWEF6_01365 [Amycolatopsis sp. NPDC004772]
MSLMGELSGAAKATESGLKLLGSLGRWFSGRREASQLARTGKSLLGFADSGIYSYRVSMHHPLYRRGDPHPDDALAFAAIANCDYSEARKSNTLELVDDVTASLSDGLVLIGSPESEAVTSLAFGYQRMPAGGMHYIGRTIDLPFRWEEDPALVRASCERIVPGRGRTARPNWPIVDQSGVRSTMRYPTVANNGLIFSDYLLITKVPNFLTEQAFQSNRSIVSIAGTHGTGTRAIDRLLSDKGALAAIARQLGPRPQAFQVLVEAGKIEHSSRRGSIAKAVTVLDVKLLDRPDSVWLEAMRSVREDYAKWLQESSKE